jgi:hypothetical protein
MKRKLIRISILLLMMTVISVKYDNTSSGLFSGLQAVAQEETSRRRPAKTNRRAAKTAFLSWKRNPFAIQKMPGGGLSVELELKGVVWYDKEPKAMLSDGSIVGVGDRAGSDVVVAITEDSVTLRRGTKKYKIRLEY